jgi:hypothetical protein
MADNKLPIADKVFLTSSDFINPAINPNTLEPAFATVFTALSAKSAIPVSFKKLDCFAVSQAELRRFPVHDPTLSPIDIKSFAVLNKVTGIPSLIMPSAVSFIITSMRSLYISEALPD